jgi:hypothetical protein
MDRLGPVSGMPSLTFLMEDSVDGGMSVGTSILALWAAKSLKFSDVEVSQNETNFRLVSKDSEAARGKRMCVSGMLVQIEVEKTPRGKMSIGLLYDSERDLYRFIAAKSSGTLLSEDKARFCGFVTEKMSYKQNGGTTGVAVTLVGMFDLPENRN